MPSVVFRVERYEPNDRACSALPFSMFSVKILCCVIRACPSLKNRVTSSYNKVNRAQYFMQIPDREFKVDYFVRGVLHSYIS